KNIFFDKNKFEYVYIDYLFMPKKIFYHFRGKLMFYGSQKLIQKTNLMKNIDLIHAHVALPDGQMAMNLSKKYGIPYVVTIHGQDFQVSLKRKKWRNAIEEILRNAAGIIFVSEKLENIF